MLKKYKGGRLLNLVGGKNRLLSDVSPHPQEISPLSKTVKTQTLLFNMIKKIFPGNALFYIFFFKLFKYILEEDVQFEYKHPELFFPDSKIAMKV